MLHSKRYKKEFRDTIRHENKRQKLNLFRNENNSFGNVDFSYNHFNA